MAAAPRGGGGGGGGAHPPPAAWPSNWRVGVAAPLALFGLALFIASPHSRIPKHASAGEGVFAAITREMLDPTARCGLDTPGWWEVNASLADPDVFIPPAALWKWRTEGDCAYSIRDFDDFVAAFAGRTLTFMGDSTMRTAFFDFTCALLRCFDGSDQLGPRDGDLRGWDAGRARQCQHCDGGRFVPSAVLPLGERYGHITLRWYWLSWMDYLEAAPEPESPAWGEDWRSYVDTIPREWDFDALFNADPGDFFVLGNGLWELKFPGRAVNETEAVDTDAAVAFYTASLGRMLDALQRSVVGTTLAAEGRFVLRGLPLAERGGEAHLAARAAAGATGPITHPHYATPLTAAAAEAQADALDGTSIPFLDVRRMTHYPLSAERTGVTAPPRDEDGFVLTTDGTHPRAWVSLLQMRALLSFFADSAQL